ncbi:unannotated protein [freshwater metagenome]|uniref:Unannotated protein n=1 Tax=freshwater metagenome TaxID=449393 RepID=A0A6J7FCF0_9ZZZZ
MTYAMISSEKPKASETASTFASLLAIRIAVPGPPSISTVVPKASAPRIRALFCITAPSSRLVLVVDR